MEDVVEKVIGHMRCDVNLAAEFNVLVTLIREGAEALLTFYNNKFVDTIATRVMEDLPTLSEGPWPWAGVTSRYHRDGKIPACQVVGL